MHTTFAVCGWVSFIKIPNIKRPTLIMNSQDASVRRFDLKTDFELDQVDIGKWVLHWIALQCFHETENYEYGRWHAKKGFLIDPCD